jgi:hypothetical protein
MSEERNQKESEDEKTQREKARRTEKNFNGTFLRDDKEIMRKMLWSLSQRGCKAEGLPIPT